MTGKAKRKMSPGALAILFLVGAFVIDLAVFYTLPLGLLYPEMIDNNETRTGTAAILFNDFNDDFTGINDETKRRIHHGISLLEKGEVKQLVAVGGNREKSRRKGAQLMADYMLEQGVTAGNIIVEAGSNDSISNLQQLEQLLGDREIVVLGVISSPYHLLRIKTMDIPLRFKLSLSAYDPASCIPPLTRSEVWFSAHYNALACLAQTFLPESLYRKVVLWVRENTEW